MQVTVLWAVVAGLYAALPAFQEYVTPVEFACLCVTGSLLMLVGRLTKQPGVP